ncbi:response regulator [Desulfobacula phenolica]|uniref:histidine kinase n=1 Tax=Desulfobacula phenolica TaxID=90732 RepID=A0A1H2DPG7_9BACT|nr:response regulator [Desulfobacula phenolica]SDT84797.1 signal transduction histidine kinase [Desulfobacula phenolica]
MNIGTFFKGTIRSKIFIGFFIAVIPMIIIVFINYYPTRENTIQTACRLMALSAQNCSERLNAYFNARGRVFINWTEDDVFGMAIEFNTIIELKEYFSSLMKNHPEFLLLLFTDENGKVLEAAFREDTELMDIKTLKGTIVTQTAQLKEGNDHSVSLVKNDFVKKNGWQNSYTALYSFKTRDSSGRQNGFFLAYLDWSIIQGMIDQLYVQMIQNRFKSSHIAMIDANTQIIISHSVKEFLNRRLSPDRSLEKIKPAKDKKAVKISTERGVEYVISKPLIMASTFLTLKKTGDFKPDIYLAVFVAQKDILSSFRKIVGFAVAVAGIGCSVIFLICFILAQSITSSTRELVRVLEASERGDMDVRAGLTSKDEIGFLAERFNAMLEQINESSSILKKSESKYRLIFNNLQNAINKKEFSFRFTPDSNKDDLVVSMNKMLATLEKADTETSSQDWLKTGQANLNNTISGERNLTTLCQKAITCIAKYVGAQVATFFVRDTEKEEFVLITNYAFRQRKGFMNRFKPGEGLTGQAALEKQRILFTEVPNDYMKIESSLGAAVPKNILVLPLIFEQDVKGVIEIGMVSSFTKLQIDFIELAGDILAVALNTAMFNEKLEELLEQTKQQSLELQEQQEELKAANEELEEQTVILKKSESKLQLQQEELQASNEELEEKTEILEAQKNEIEKKNTSLKIKQREVEEKAEQLELATRYKSQFLANMSHELRTPLNSLLILANMLAENEDQNLTAEQVESARSIHRSGQNLLRLINDILDLSKIEAGKIDMNISKISVESLGANCKTEFMHMAKAKGIEFKLDLKQNLPKTITTDELKLNQIIRNLMGNAVKFTEKGSVALIISRPDPDVKFDAKDRDRKKTIAICVADTGPGIPHGQLQLIFEAFKQVDGTISRRYGGTGLGLSISRELAILIGGELKVRSTPGKGSFFTLYIPEIYADEKIALSPEKKKTKELKTIPEKKESQKEILVTQEAYFPGKTMLIIEDDNEFSAILAAFFQKNGYESIIASDGETGIKFVIEHQPTAIILDIGLPGIDGWAVLSELKNNPATRHIPVHIMSAFDNTRQGLEKGAVGYLTKPVDTRGLQKALNRIESVLASDVKELLIVEDDKELKMSILKLMKTNDINAVAVETGNKALGLLKKQKFDCMILDLGLPDITGFELLDIINTDPVVQKIPVIIYTGRDLSREETQKLERYSSSIVLKSAVSMERLLDETALFMHRVEKDMPENHKKIIQSLRERESILPGKKVLLVDDDMRNAFALNKFLKSKGMDVVIADNGQKALDILDQGIKPDIILMDIMMPVMDGYQTMKKIRKQKEFKSLPILALTAKAMESDREECIKCGANDYLSKPIDTSKLLTMLRIWLYS